MIMALMLCLYCVKSPRIVKYLLLGCSEARKISLAANQQRSRQVEEPM
jgi:hypothetical protein